MNIQLHKILALAAGFLAIIFWVLVFAAWWQSPRGRTEVVFLDVGQGDAVLIKSAGQHYILIDGGSGRAVLDRLGANLPFYLKKLDLVIATHPDADHIGGLPSVLGKYEVGQVLEPGIEHDSATFRSWRQAIGEKKIETKFVQARLLYDLGGSAFLDILYPNSDLVGKILPDNNTASIVAKLTDQEIDFLLTGDAPVAVEEKLLAAYGDYLDSEVLKIGHHGSKTSSAPDFLRAVSPEVAVIQVGGGNRYGHPASEVLRRLGQQDIFVLRNDQRGDIRLSSDGGRVTLLK